MATNFSSLILYFPAVHEIGSSDAGTTAQVERLNRAFTEHRDVSAPSSASGSPHCWSCSRSTLCFERTAAKRVGP
jgi:hypothetical protein